MKHFELLYSVHTINNTNIDKLQISFNLTHVSNLLLIALNGDVLYENVGLFITLKFVGNKLMFPRLMKAKILKRLCYLWL